MRNTILLLTAAALAVSASALPAHARGWHGGGRGGAAVAAGIAGFAVGTALANDGGYPAPDYYGAPPAYDVPVPSIYVSPGVYTVGPLQAACGPPHWNPYSSTRVQTCRNYYRLSNGGVFWVVP